MIAVRVWRVFLRLQKRNLWYHICISNFPIFILNIQYFYAPPFCWCRDQAWDWVLIFLWEIKYRHHMQTSLHIWRNLDENQIFRRKNIDIKDRMFSPFFALFLVWLYFVSENIDSWDAHHKFLTLSEIFFGAILRYLQEFAFF